MIKLVYREKGKKELITVFLGELSYFDRSWLAACMGYEADHWYLEGTWA
jgi:hypothetical protein